MLLADIGNTRIHIYNGKEVVHLSHREAIEQYGDKKLRYITVKHQLKKELDSLPNWIDVSEKIKLKNEYATMGIDRKALCLSHRDGIFISAGTAITVDVVKDGRYQGGFLLLGLRAYVEAYAKLSPALEIKLDERILLDSLPIGTREGISYGVIASIKALVDKHQGELQLYISGGDGAFLSSFFDGAIFDERLIFFGIERSI